jgi:hypothetical protein
VAIRMSKPWSALTPEAVRAVPGQLGVYQLADANERVVCIGFAGGRSLFGLRGELQGTLAQPPFAAALFRYEVNQQYTTRFNELLMLHLADHGVLPPANRAAPPARLGRLSPL